MEYSYLGIFAIPRVYLTRKYGSKTKAFFSYYIDFLTPWKYRKKTQSKRPFLTHFIREDAFAGPPRTYQTFLFLFWRIHICFWSIFFGWFEFRQSFQIDKRHISLHPIEVSETYFKPSFPTYILWVQIQARTKFQKPTRASG